jgi:hypothetical protein
MEVQQIQPCGEVLVQFKSGMGFGRVNHMHDARATKKLNQCRGGGYGCYPDTSTSFSSSESPGVNMLWRTWFLESAWATR